MSMSVRSTKEKNAKENKHTNTLLKNERPSLVSVSLVAVFLATMVLNEIVKSTSLSVQAKSRQVASINQAEVKKEISWEHNWAKQLSAHKTVTGQTAIRPNMQDELLYGTLEGIYNVQFENGKIVSLELNHEQKLNHITKINPADLLEKYKEFFSDRLQKVRPSENIGENQSYDLIGSNNQVLGKALVEYNSEGQVRKLSIKNL